MPSKSLPTGLTSAGKKLTLQAKEVTSVALHLALVRTLVSLVQMVVSVAGRVGSKVVTFRKMTRAAMEPCRPLVAVKVRVKALAWSTTRLKMLFLKKFYD